MSNHQNTSYLFYLIIIVQPVGNNGEVCSMQDWHFWILPVGFINPWYTSCVILNHQLLEGKDCQSVRYSRGLHFMCRETSDSRVLISKGLI